MAVNLAMKYQKKVDEKFTQEELTGKMGGSDYDITGVKSVVVYQIDDAEENDYTRSGTNRYGTPEELGDETHTKTMTQDKSFTFTIDRGNRNEQMMIKEAGKRLAAELKNVSIPNRDRYNIHVASTLAKLRGNVIASGSLTKTNIYEKFCEVMEMMDEDSIPTKGRLCYVKPGKYNLLKRCDEFTKYVDAGKKMSINGSIGDVDDVAIIKAPSKYFPAGVDMLFIHPKVCATPKTLSDYKIHDNPPGINGWLVEGRIIYDLFLSDANPKGVYILASGVGLTSQSLASKTTTGSTRFKLVRPNLCDEGTLTYKYKFDTSAITAPAEGTAEGSLTGYTALPKDDTDIAGSTNTHYMIVAIKDAKVFISGGGTLAKK